MTLSDDFPLLSRIDTPADLRALARTDLAAVAEELRRYLIVTVSRMGGHFAAGLGTVELTVALHYIFDTPHDRLVWDVGHQAYPHKVLTGRRDALRTIKQHHGLAPFPTRSESEYDTFGVGHSSTSISAALGMAIGAAVRGEQRRVVAVIGDGAMTAGMAFEALNHAGSLDANLLVVLNDNDMSISNNVGAMSNYFARVLSGKLYATLREGGKKVLRQMPTVWELARRSEEHMKGMILPGTIFEELGLNYIGPVDGHDLNALVATLENMRDLKGPQLLHVVTRKGKGYAPAEADPIKWHGPGPFDPASATIFKEKASGPTYSQIFGQWLCDIAARDPRIVAITPAMREGSGMVEFERKFPDRYFDVGIAEQHAVTFAAGLACEGVRPVVAIYSSFLQRGYDQLVHDVALQNLPVVFAIDRAGLVGGDGATHQGSYDLGIMRCLPNMVIMAPSNEDECRQMLYTATHDRRAVRGAVSARHGPRRAGSAGNAGDPDRPRPRAARGAQRACAARVRQHGRERDARRRATRRHGRQHALRQADRREPDRPHRGQESAHRHARGKRRRRRRGQRRRRGTERPRPPMRGPAHRHPGPPDRARLARQQPRGRGARPRVAGIADRRLVAAARAARRRRRRVRCLILRP